MTKIAGSYFWTGSEADGLFATAKSFGQEPQNNSGHHLQIFNPKYELLFIFLNALKKSSMFQIMDILKDPKIKKAVEILKKEFDAKRIFLFGSRVTGAAETDSDYDFVVVSSKARTASHLELATAKALLHSELDILSDLFVYTEKDFMTWENEFSSIPETAKNTGVEIPL